VQQVEDQVGRGEAGEVEVRGRSGRRADRGYHEGGLVAVLDGGDVDLGLRRIGELNVADAPGGALDHAVDAGALCPGFELSGGGPRRAGPGTDLGLELRAHGRQER